MTNDEMERFIKAAILMTDFAIMSMIEYLSKHITETQDEKDLNELLERVRNVLRKEASDEYNK